MLVCGHKYLDGGAVKKGRGDQEPIHLGDFLGACLGHDRVPFELENISDDLLRGVGHAKADRAGEEAFGRLQALVVLLELHFLELHWSRAMMRWVELSGSHASFVVSSWA